MHNSSLYTKIRNACSPISPFTLPTKYKYYAFNYLDFTSKSFKLYTIFAKCEDIYGTDKYLLTNHNQTIKIYTHNKSKDYKIYKIITNHLICFLRIDKHLMDFVYRILLNIIELKIRRCEEYLEAVLSYLKIDEVREFREYENSFVFVYRDMSVVQYNDKLEIMRIEKSEDQTNIINGQINEEDQTNIINEQINEEDQTNEINANFENVETGELTNYFEPTKYIEDDIFKMSLNLSRNIKVKESKRHNLQVQRIEHLKNNTVYKTEDRLIYIKDDQVQIVTDGIKKVIKCKRIKKVQGYGNYLFLKTKEDIKVVYFGD